MGRRIRLLVSSVGLFFKKISVNWFWSQVEAEVNRLHKEEKK